MSEPIVSAKVAPSPDDFVQFVPYLCAEMQAPFYIEIQKVTIEEYVNKDAKGKNNKSKRAIDMTEGSTTAAAERAAVASSSPFTSRAQGPGVRLTAVCDTAGRLMELQFCRCSEIPTLLLRAITMCLPYHPSLARISVRWGPPQGRLLNELAALLPLSNVTELCLDDSPTPEGTCHELLAQPTRLRSLSMARCDLSDKDATLLAAHLQHPKPASRTLTVLSLASNAIADVGATALSEALRTNRTLRYLNLAGNQITDDGATTLLSSLTRFRLRPDEIIGNRKRLIEHLKRKEVIYAKCVNELMVASGEKASSDKSASSGKRRMPVTRPRQTSVAATMSSIALRAEAMTGELLGPLLEPFSAENTVRRANGLYCRGNLTLCYLNLAYNNLHLASLAQLVHVLQTQAWTEGAAGRSGTAVGLLRVQVDGNLLPAVCVELEIVSELLAHALGCGEQKQPAKRNDRAKRK